MRNRALVYAKDDVPPLSFHPDDGDEAVRDLSDVGRRLGEWIYVVGAGSDAYAEELAEFVHKFTAVSHA